jgi:hypothetical protein
VASQKWYLTFSPVVTADSEVSGGQRWTVLAGRIVGRSLRRSTKAMTALWLPGMPRAVTFILGPGVASKE